MAEVVQNADHDFWRAPLAAPVADSTIAAVPSMVEICDRCRSEFVMGAGFCHVCGATRSSKSVASPSPRWTRHLEFHHIKERMGLPTASLVAFLIGVACALCALGVGLVFSVATILDWQAIQLYRVEWLLGSAAAFLAGILLKQAAKQG